MKPDAKARKFTLRAINVRSTHVHVVISKAMKPEKIVNDFKIYATRKLRAENEFSGAKKIWSRGASTRYLWKPRNVEGAIDYVLYSQGDVPFETVFEIDRKV
jgi:REP element-mobilizing transposase RayT